MRTLHGLALIFVFSVHGMGQPPSGLIQTIAGNGVGGQGSPDRYQDSGVNRHANHPAERLPGDGDDGAGRASGDSGFSDPLG